MLKFLLIDSLFLVAVTIETCAVLSMFRDLVGVRLRPEFDPILGFYQETIVAALASVTQIVAAGLPVWYLDAYVISVVLFYLFFISQFRWAMTPHEISVAASDEKRDRVEMAVDGALPAIACGFGATILSFTLLPLLTPVLAVGLYLRRLMGYTSWFDVTRTYYINLAIVAALSLIAIYSSQ